MNAEHFDFLRESNAIEGVFGDGPLIDASVAWQWLMKHDVLCEYEILRTHKLLMRAQPIDDKYKGAYRDREIYIAGIRKDPVMLSQRIASWLSSMNELGPCITQDLSEGLSIDLHVEYEEIHPFIDGNGRTGRMYMNWFRIKKLGLPLMIINRHETEGYYAWFNKDIGF